MVVFVVVFFVVFVVVGIVFVFVGVVVLKGRDKSILVFVGVF